MQAVTVGDYFDSFPSLESDFGQEDLCPFRILSLENLTPLQRWLTNAYELMPNHHRSPLVSPAL